MDDLRAARDRVDRRDSPSPRSMVVPWALIVIWGVVASVLATWLYLEREAATEELASARVEVAELRRMLVEAEGRIDELREGLQDQQDEVGRRGESIEACREALERISAAWSDVARAVQAAGELDGEEARSFAAEAERQRRAAQRAARRCR
ncbi:MAG TPA: hypothetical protein VF058_00135 [Actinomycetota bacterium]